MIRKTVIILTTAAAMAAPVIASASNSKGEYQYAKVVDVQNLYRYETVEIPHRECYTTTAHREVRREDFRHDRDRRRSGSGFSTVAGGVIGGVIGHQFGKGNGRDAMTVVGTLIGAA
ncbi:MAG: glycine zipper 2TM domain-containing protein, partial [Gammaproteobacteria bacterium]